MVGRSAGFTQPHLTDLTVYIIEPLAECSSIARAVEDFEDACDWDICSDERRFKLVRQVCLQSLVNALEMLAESIVLGMST